MNDGPVNNTTQDRAVVLAVVICLGALALVGMLGLILLMDRRVDAANLAILSPLVAGPAGALGGILAMTHTAAPALAQAKAQGYQAAVQDVAALDPAA